MNRILFALSLFLLASAATAGARATDDSEMNCPKPGGKSVAANASPVTPAAPAAAQNYVATTAGHGGPVIHPHNAAAPRVISPRWHSFLPGMFR